VPTHGDGFLDELASCIGGKPTEEELKKLTAALVAGGPTDQLSRVILQEIDLDHGPGYHQKPTWRYGHCTLDMIGQKLKEEGRIYTAKQPRWARSKIHRVLRDRSYIGEIPFHGNWLRGKHEPIVDQATFARVQELLGNKVYKAQAHSLPYAGELITCGHCGRSITGEIIIKKSGKQYRYYRCCGYLATGHPRVRLTEAQVESQIFEHLRKIEQPKAIQDWFRAAIRARATHESEQSRARARDLQRQLDEVRRQQERLLNLHLAGTVEGGMYGAKNTELRDLVADLTLQLEATDRRKDENADLAIKTFELSQNIPSKWLKSEPLEKRRILNLVYSNLVLTGATLCLATKKPFNALVEGLSVSSSGEDRI
jgi:hypothetical protein